VQEDQLGVLLMSDVPVFVFAIPVVAAGLLLFWNFAGKRMMGAADRRYSDYRVGDLAQRMGLQVIEGDPSLNLIQAQTKHNMSYGEATGGRVARFMGDTQKETRVRLEGAPYGRPTQLVFHSYTKYQDRVAIGFVTRSFEFRLSVQVPVQLPAFEIVLRKGAAYGLKAKAEWDLPRQSFGERELDDRLVLTCADPRMGPHLASVVGGLTGHKYLHIQGDGNVISSLGEEDATMYVAFDLEKTQQVLEHMAFAVAGPVQPH
jgi:hypothetical protein